MESRTAESYLYHFLRLSCNMPDRPSLSVWCTDIQAIPGNFCQISGVHVVQVQQEILCVSGDELDKLFG